MTDSSPIPSSPADLERVADHARRQIDEVRVLLGEGDEHALWRPDETRWSITGHVAHLVIVNRGYVGALESTVDAAMAKGGSNPTGPWKHPWLSRWFVRTLQPPPKQRMKTMRSMVPDPAMPPAEALEDFAALQERLAALAERTEGIDLGRVRFSSPFFRLLRLSVGGGFGLLLAHNDRHIWLMNEVNRMRAEG